MTKEYFIKLLELKKYEDKHEEIIQHLEYRFMNNDEINYDKIDEIFPNIESLKEEYKILKEEIIAKLIEYNNYKKLEQTCKHLVRVRECDIRSCLGSENDICVFCGREFPVYNYTKYDNDENIKYALFRGIQNVTKNAGFGMSDELEFENNYSINDIHAIITKILTNYNDKEIDLVNEIEKLKLDKSSIIRPKNKIKILLITGSNKQIVANSLSVIRENNINYSPLVNYFKDLYNVYIDIIKPRDELPKVSGDNISYIDYSFINNLENNLKYRTDTNYSLIIDLTRLFIYDPNSNTFNNYYLDLTKLFNDTPILYIRETYNDPLTDKIDISNEYTYLYYGNNYYVLDNDKYIYTKSEDIAKRIKKLVKFKD